MKVFKFYADYLEMRLLYLSIFPWWWGSTKTLLLTSETLINVVLSIFSVVLLLSCVTQTSLIFLLVCIWQDVQRFKLDNPRAFHYLNQSNCYELDGVDDSKEYIATRRAMEVVGISAGEQVFHRKLVQLEDMNLQV